MTPIAVVTGGSGGLGAAIMKHLGEAGFEVRDFSRRAGVDAADEGSVEAALAALPRIDALVNNAATLIVSPIAQMAAADWDQVLRNSLRSAFLCSRGAFRRMPPGGAIVNVSSLSGVAGAQKFAGMAAYVAAKSGLAGLTEVLAVEGQEAGIRVNAVSPGAVDTPMLQISGVQGPRLPAADVARVVAWLASPASAPLSGANLRFDALALKT